MALPASDAFTRADNAALGANWTDRINGFGITSNQAKASATANCVSVWTADAFGNDHLSQVTLVDYTSRFAGPVARFTTSSTANGYAWLTDPTAVLKGYRCDNGTFTAIFTPGTAVANGDILKLSITGTTQSYYKNGTLIGTTTDATYGSGGAAGIYGNGAGVLLDNWSGDNAGSGGGGRGLFRVGASLAIGVGGSYFQNPLQMSHY